MNTKPVQNSACMVCRYARAIHTLNAQESQTINHLRCFSSEDCTPDETTSCLCLAGFLLTPTRPLQVTAGEHGHLPAQTHNVLCCPTLALHQVTQK